MASTETANLNALAIVAKEAEYGKYYIAFGKYGVNMWCENTGFDLDTVEETVTNLLQKTNVVEEDITVVLIT